jgi:hypothetical protein
LQSRAEMIASQEREVRSKPCLPLLVTRERLTHLRPTR